MRYNICFFKVYKDIVKGGKLVLSNPNFVTADSIYHLRSQLDILCDKDDVIVLSVEPMASFYKKSEE